MTLPIDEKLLPTTLPATLSSHDHEWATLSGAQDNALWTYTMYTSNGDPVDKRALGADFDVLSRADQVCASQATMRDGEPFKILRKLSFDRARVTRVAGHPTQVRSGDQGGDR